MWDATEQPKPFQFRMNYVKTKNESEVKGFTLAKEQNVGSFKVNHFKHLRAVITGFESAIFEYSWKIGYVWEAVIRLIFTPSWTFVSFCKNTKL